MLKLLISDILVIGYVKPSLNLKSAIGPIYDPPTWRNRPLLSILLFFRSATVASKPSIGNHR